MNTIVSASAASIHAGQSFKSASGRVAARPQQTPHALADVARRLARGAPPAPGHVLDGELRVHQPGGEPFVATVVDISDARQWERA